MVKGVTGTPVDPKNGDGTRTTARFDPQQQQQQQQPALHGVSDIILNFILQNEDSAHTPSLSREEQQQQQ